MPPRLIVAFTLLLLIALSAAALVAFGIYNSPKRQYRRRLRRDAVKGARLTSSNLAEESNYRRR